MKKRLLLTSILLLTVLSTLLACPTCEKQQPEVLKDISHGAGPKSDWDMVIVWGTAAITLTNHHPRWAKWPHGLSVVVKANKIKKAFSG